MTKEPDQQSEISPPEVLGIRQIKIPVTDLARSVRWYGALFGLRLHREFVEQGVLAGAVLAHPSGFVLSVRLRERIPGSPLLAGFDLFSLGVSSRDDLEVVAAQAHRLSSECSEIVDRGVDGYHLDVADPDGMMIRLLAPPNDKSAIQRGIDPAHFVGVSFDSAAVPSFYGVPRLASAIVRELESRMTKSSEG